MAPDATSRPIVRDARPDDLPAIVAIYNAIVESSVATFDLRPFTVEERRSWFGQFGAEHPMLVAEVDGVVRGFAYYAPFRDKPAYARTKESTIYLDLACVGRGLGSALYEELIRRARAAGVHSLVAVLGGENTASEALHRKFGYEHAGGFREVGHKFGGWVDIHFFQLLL